MSSSNQNSETQSLLYRNNFGLKRNLLGATALGLVFALGSPGMARAQVSHQCEDAIALLQAGVSGDGQRFNDVENTVAEQQLRIQNMETSLSSTMDAVSLLNSDFETLELRVDTLQIQLAETRDQVRTNTSGIAIANALSGATWLQSNEDFAVTGSWGYFDGEGALAFSAAARMDHNWSASWALGIAPEGGQVGARAGVRFGW